MGGSILILGDVVGFASTTVQSDSEKELWLRIGNDDPIVVYHNGCEVYRQAGNAGLRMTRLPVRLQAGENTLLVKAVNRENFNWWWWGFVLRLESEDGESDPSEPGLRFQLPSEG